VSDEALQFVVAEQPQRDWFLKVANNQVTVSLLDDDPEPNAAHFSTLLTFSAYRPFGPALDSKVTR
jgi:hypothetical protein